MIVIVVIILIMGSGGRGGGGGGGRGKGEEAGEGWWTGVKTYLNHKPVKSVMGGDNCHNRSGWHFWPQCRQVQTANQRALHSWRKRYKD